MRHLLVEEQGRLVGVLSNRDLLGLTGWKILGPEDSLGDSPRFVAQVMHADPVTIDPQDEVVAAAVEVSVQAVGCLPVIEDGQLIGIVSEMDLLRLIAEGASQAKAGAGKVPTIGSIGAPRALTMDAKATLSDRDMRRAVGAGLRLDTPASEIMTEGAVTVPVEASLVQAAEAMNGRKISALVVTSESGYLGIVTTTDVLEYALNSV